MNKIMNKIMNMLFLGFIAISTQAAVIYNKSTNTIQVSDFTEAVPCTVQKLLQLDGMYKWNKINYDKEDNTYHINCNLSIGESDKTNTYFQIGNETVVLDGNLIVKPTWVKGKTHQKAWWVVQKEDHFINRLTMGDKGNEAIKAVLKIKGADHFIRIGGESSSTEHGGELCMYNSTITSAGSVRFKQVMLEGVDKAVIINSTISNVKRDLMKYVYCGTFENSTFENGGIGIKSRKVKYMKNCTFRKLAVGFYGYQTPRRAETVLDGCNFESNTRNIILNTGNFICVDCTFGAPLKANQYKGKAKLHVKFHTQVKVVDASGKPVADARIKIVPNQKNIVFENDVDDVLTAITNKQGVSPLNSKSALLLTAWTADVNSEKTIHSYTINIEANGKTAGIKDFKPASPNQILTVTLK